MRRQRVNVIQEHIGHAVEVMLPYRAQLDGLSGKLCRSAQRLTRMPCTGGNEVRLLVDGGVAFSAMLEAIANAKQYVLVQFFIVQEGTLSEVYRDVLSRKAREGVPVYFLYDELGSRKLRRRYVRSLKDAGIHVSSYRAVLGRAHRLQLNFRNHRKVTVVDGHTAFVGGLNLSDEYLGRNPRLRPWRDTHLQVFGPAALATQLSFFEDWHWATGDVLDLTWNPRSGTSGRAVSVIPTGPADTLEACQLLILQAIHAASERLWIASPYFVPGPAVCAALQLAVVRGVDVRILLPQNPDHRLVYLAAFSYYEEMELAGVGIYRYQPGFMHQKVMLIDDNMASVGTVNLDNRSFHLNFEITMLVVDSTFAQSVRNMLEEDFARSEKARAHELQNRGALFRLSVLVARLFAPIL